MAFSFTFRVTTIYRLAGLIEGVLLVRLAQQFEFGVALIAFTLLHVIASLSLEWLTTWLERMAARS